MSKPLPRRRTQARGRVTRARLRSAAQELFKRNGYETTSMSDVARRAEVGIGTLYHHFPDKRALLLELVDDWGDRVAADRRSELDYETFLGSDPRAAIHGALHRAFERLQKRPSMYLVVLSLADRDPEVRARYQRLEQIAVERLTELVRFAAERGLVRAEVDASTAAFLIHHAIDMATTQLLVRDGAALAPDRVLKGLADMICRYILKE